MGATVQHQQKVARWQLHRRLKKALRLRRIKKSDAKILANNENTTLDLMPRTLEEALPSDAAKREADERAIVVTEMTGTFNMIGCNKAWENLCGYAECEILGKDSSILQGPETNHMGKRDIHRTSLSFCNSTYEYIPHLILYEHIVSSLTQITGLRDAVQRLFEEEKPVRICTTNYRKDGSAFKNLLTLGPIYDKASGKMTHCIAILKNIGNVSAAQ